MALHTVNGIDDIKALIGQPVGPSDWREVTQEDVNRFAELSGDHQWIHVDVERAKNESPFGTTIAHGNLTLATRDGLPPPPLLPPPPPPPVDGFRTELISSTGFVLGVNYGWNKIRFPAPVPVDSRIRAKAEVVSVYEEGSGWYGVLPRFPPEAGGGETPSSVGYSVPRVMAPAP